MNGKQFEGDFKCCEAIVCVMHGVLISKLKHEALDSGIREPLTTAKRSKKLTNRPFVTVGHANGNF